MLIPPQKEKNETALLTLRDAFVCVRCGDVHSSARGSRSICWASDSGQEERDRTAPVWIWAQSLEAGVQGDGCEWKD